MSAPGTKEVRRPKGLLNSKKRMSGDHEPKEKRAKLEHPTLAEEEVQGSSSHQEKPDVAEEDWDDLMELFENACNACDIAEWGTSAPLLRGAIHECDRFIRHDYEPHKSTRCNPAAFNTIHGSALYLLGVAISEDPSIVSPGEPVDPCDYFEAAKNALAQGEASAHETEWMNDPWSIKLKSTMGLSRLSILETRLKKESNNGSATTAAFTALIQLSNDLVKAFSPIMAKGSSSTFSPDDDPFPSRVKSIQGVMDTYISLVERTFPSDVHSAEKLMQWVLELLEDVESDRVHSMAFVALRGKTLLIIGSSWAELYEQTLSEDDDQDLNDDNAVKARTLLKKAITHFENALKLAPTPSEEKGDEKINGEPEGTAPQLRLMLAEALVTLASLTEDGAEQAELFSQAKSLGVDVDAESFQDEAESESDSEL